jgi:hypothetical protein
VSFSPSAVLFVYSVLAAGFSASPSLGVYIAVRFSSASSFVALGSPA